MTITVAVVDAAVTTELRRAVLRPTWTPGTPMHGDERPDAVHIAALDDDGTPVGTCVLLPNRYPHRELPDPWQLRAMATAEGSRSAGVGTLVIRGAVDAIHERGGRSVWCMARVVALRFYERNGFVADTEVYLQPETGLPHRDMYRLL